MGVAVEVEGLSKSFGSQNIWSDVTLTLPPGEISVLLGPSGTGKSVFLKSLVGLLKPEQGSIVIKDIDLVRTSEHKLYEIRKLFGVLFQDGALFGSMNLFDNIAFPLREHTKKSESEIKSHRPREDGDGRSAGRRGQAPRGDLRRYAQARRPGPGAGARPRDHPVRRAGLRPRPGPRRLPEPADRRPQRPDRRDLPDRHARHRHGPHGAGQPRPALPPQPGDVRPARAAAHLPGARRPAVPQRPPRGPDRHERGEGRRPGRGRDEGARGARRRLAQRRRPQGRQRWRRRPAAADAHRGPARAQGRAPPPGAGGADAARVRRGDRRRRSASPCPTTCWPRPTPAPTSRPRAAGGRHWAPEADGTTAAGRRHRHRCPRQGDEG